MNPITIPCWCLVDADGNVTPRYRPDGCEDRGAGDFNVFSIRAAAESKADEWQERTGVRLRIVEAVATVEAVDVPVVRAATIREMPHLEVTP